MGKTGTDWKNKFLFFLILNITIFQINRNFYFTKRGSRYSRALQHCSSIGYKSEFQNICVMWCPLAASKKIPLPHVVFDDDQQGPIYQ